MSFVPPVSRHLLSILLLVAAASAQTSRNNLLRAQTTIASGGFYATALAVADVDHNGHPDIVVANQNGNSMGTVGVLLNHGQDTAFDSPLLFNTGGPNPTALAVADLNKDGKLDIIVANSGTKNTVGVLRGRGDGTFGTVSTYSLGAYPASSIAIADVNGDGYPDVVTSGVSVLLNRGTGGFYPAVHYETGTGTSVTLADVNGDGKLDIVAGYDTQVGVMLGNGDGTFQPAVYYPSGGYRVTAVAVKDLNADGKPDIALVNSCAQSSCHGRQNFGVFGILPGNGDGSFGSLVTYTTDALFATSMAIADLDGDGRADVLVGNLCAGFSGNCGPQGSISTLYGNADGSYQQYFFFDSSSPVMSMVYADINGGKPDVVFASGLSGIGIMGGQRVSSATTLVGSPNPAVANQAVTFTATVSASIGSVPDGRQIIFSDGGTQIGTAPTLNGVAKFTTPLAAGNHSIRAYFPLAGAFTASGHYITEVVKP